MTRRLALIGLPESGKSSFLAALQHLLGVCEVRTGLHLLGTRGNAAHANRLAERWQEVQPLQRTAPEAEGMLALDLVDQEDGRHFSLEMPDLSGERYEQISGLRSCSPDLFAALTDAAGLLVFVNVQRQFESLTIGEMAGYGAEVQDPPAGLAAAETPSASAGPQAKSWDPTGMPEQAHLVEILNVINRYPNRPRKRRIAVMLSAWDTAMDDGFTPEAWLEQHRFLLARYLANNPELFDARVYGVSAWGADPKDPEAARRLRGHPEASRRIVIVGPEVGPHDLTAPVKWLSLA